MTLLPSPDIIRDAIGLHTQFIGEILDVKEDEQVIGAGQRNFIAINHLLQVVVIGNGPHSPVFTQCRIRLTSGMISRLSLLLLYLIHIVQDVELLT